MFLFYLFAPFFRWTNLAERWTTMATSNKNPISLLQEMCQKSNYRVPEYKELPEKRTGMDNQPTFTVRVSFGSTSSGHFTAEGQGPTKQAAKAAAAQSAYDSAVLRSNNRPRAPLQPLNISQAIPAMQQNSTSATPPSRHAEPLPDQSINQLMKVLTVSPLKLTSVVKSP